MRGLIEERTSLDGETGCAEHVMWKLNEVNGQVVENSTGKGKKLELDPKRQ